jgi:ABC-type transport system substrate-binding protein
MSAAVVTVWLASLCACGPAIAGGSAGAQPPSGPTLSIGVTSPVNSLNPVTIVNAEEANFAHFVWAGLLGVSSSGSLFPMLARAVPTVSNGLIAKSGRAITFRLRPHLRWSDGVLITANDVVFGWKLAVQLWADLCPATCGSISSVTAGAPTIVTFHLRRPFSPLLFGLPPVLPRHQLWKGSWPATFRHAFDAGDNFLGPGFAVDGPYRVQSSTTTTVTFERNPSWHIFTRPVFDTVKVTYYPLDVELLSAVETGKIDVAQGFQEFDFNRGIIPNTPPTGLRLELFPVAGIEHLEPNLLPYLSDARVRQALSLVIARNLLLQQSLGVTPAQSSRLVAYGPEMPGRFDGIAVRGAWDPVRRRFVRDVTQRSIQDANALLDSAGWRRRSDGWRWRPGCHGDASTCRDLLLLVPKGDFNRIREAESVAHDWKAIGIKTLLDKNTWALGNILAPYAQNGPCAHGWFKLCLLADVPGIDPQTDFQLEFSSRHIARLNLPRASITDINYPGIRDPEIDSVFLRDAATYDLGVRARLLRGWQVRVAKRAYWIPLFQHPLIVMLRSGAVKLNPSPLGAEWNPWALRPAR